MAIDPAAGQIYWSNFGDKSIRGAPLAGGGTVDMLYGGGGARGGVRNPGTVAIDPNPAEPAPVRLEANGERLAGAGWVSRVLEWLRDLFPSPSSSPGLIYWSNSGRAQWEPDYGDNNAIRRAPLAGGGTIDTLYGPAQRVSLPGAVAVLRAPVGTGAPMISLGLILFGDEVFTGMQFGGGNSGPSGRLLRCSRGTWAPDLLGSFLYRAPQTYGYQWRRDGTDIGGATTPDYEPTAPGSYTCRVTATNRAGSATQTSAAFAVSSVP